MESLKEHAVPIISGLSFLVALGFGLAWRFFWKLLKNIEMKIAELCQSINKQLINCPEERRKCRDSIYDRIDLLMVRRDAERSKERAEIWDALNHHNHHPDSGKVIR